MNRNEKKKITWIDTWAKFYTAGSRRRLKRTEKKRNSKFMRKYGKKKCEEETT